MLKFKNLNQQNAPYHEYVVIGSSLVDVAKRMIADGVSLSNLEGVYFSWYGDLDNEIFMIQSVNSDLSFRFIYKYKHCRDETSIAENYHDLMKLSRDLIIIEPPIC